MDPTIKSYLYEGSYFLPYIVAEESVARVKATATSEQVSSLISITYEAIELGSYRMSKQQANFDRLAWTYQTTREDLANYALGYVAPCCLILAAHLLESNSLSATIDTLVPSLEFQVDRDFRGYLVKHIFTAYQLFKNPTSGSPAEIAQAIYTICEEDPFIDSFYYKVGHAASAAVFADLCNLIDF